MDILNVIYDTLIENQPALKLIFVGYVPVDGGIGLIRDTMNGLKC